MADIELFTDSTGKMPLQDVINSHSQFVPIVPQIARIRDEKHAVWLRFKFSKATNIPYAVVGTSPIYHWLDLYSPDEIGNYSLQKSGFKIPMLKHPIFDTNYGFYVKVVKNRWYYIRIIANSGLGVHVHATIPQNHHNYVVRHYTYYGFFYGILFIAALYSIILYLKIKERAYLYYTAYVVCFGLFSSMVWGLITVIPFINYIGWDKNFYTIPFASMTCFLLLYARSFLATKENLPIFHKILTWLVWGRVVVYLIGLLIDSDELYSAKTDDLFLLGAFAAGIARLRQGYKPARFYLLAFSITYLGFFVHAFRISNFLTGFAFSPFDFYNAGIYEIILFSFGLVERFRHLKAEKEQADRRTIEYLQENNNLKDTIIKQLNENELLKDKVNRELEQKVAERTIELQKLNEELRAQSEEIDRMNKLLEQDNTNLKINVKKIAEDRVMQKRVSFDEFKSIYPDEDACFRYLELLKWPEGKFTCKKCGNNKYSKGNSPYSRRCSKCNHIERIYTDTVFSGIKFPITKAFYMLFLVATGKNTTVEELSESLDLRKQTCWAFRKKLKSTIDEKKSKTKNRDGWSHLILTNEL